MRTCAVNGLNQYTAAGPATFTYDANGNLTGDGSNTYSYDVENRLIGVSSARVASLIYDPLGRLFETSNAPLNSGGTITRFVYDPGSGSGAGGDALVEEYNSAHQLLRRYVHGADSAADDPLFAYEGAGLSDRRSLHVDHQGSVIASANTGGTLRQINTYDEYGIPAPANQGRFQYTGQVWLPEIGMYYYKARIYSPTLGRFLQTDPIGYEGGLNIYAYGENDPINNSDPSGLISIGSCEGDKNGNVGSGCSGQNVISASNAHAEQQANAGAQRPGAGALGRAASSISNAIQEVDDTLDAAADIASDALDAVTYSLSELAEDITNPSIPSEAYETYGQYKEQNYQFRPGQAYDVHRYSNRGGELPSGGQYRSMFVKQFDFSRSFGPKSSERLIVDVKSGAAYYTPDHYRTFRKLGK